MDSQTNNFLEACDQGRTADALALLPGIGSIDVRDPHGCTALHRAARNGHRGTCLALLDHGSDVNARENEGCTPLHDASFFNEPAVCRVLVERGADINALDNQRRTPLELSAVENRAPAALELLALGARTLVNPSPLYSLEMLYVLALTRLEASAQTKGVDLLVRAIVTDTEPATLPYRAQSLLATIEKDDGSEQKIFVLRSWLASQAARNLLSGMMDPPLPIFRALIHEQPKVSR